MGPTASRYGQAHTFPRGCKCRAAQAWVALEERDQARTGTWSWLSWKHHLGVLAARGTHRHTLALGDSM